MMRFGIYRREQFSAVPGPIARLLHGHRVSLQLLRTATSPTPENIAIFDDIVYYLRLASGAYTTTSSGRFRDFDVWLSTRLCSLFPSDRPLRVEEWGASDRVTSAEWFPELRRHFPRVELRASDQTVYLIEAAIDGDGVYVLDPGGEPLQYIAPPFVVRFPEAAPLVVNRIIAASARRRLASRARRAGVDLTRIRFADGEEMLRRPPFTFRPLSLVHPCARALAAETPAFSLGRHNVFEPSPDHPDIIRTMNVLNLDYFPPTRLADAVAAVWQSLPFEGIWIVGRTLQESSHLHHASILRRTTTGFTVVDRHLGASEVESIALACRF